LPPKMGSDNVPPKYSIDKCCQLLGTSFAMMDEPKARSSYFSQIYILYYIIYYYFFSLVSIVGWVWNKCLEKG
jgi:hypothetical protein